MPLPGRDPLLRDQHAQAAGVGEERYPDPRWPPLLQGRAMNPSAPLSLELILLLFSAGVTWQVQDWHYGKQLAEQAGLHQVDLTATSNALAAQVRANQDKRLALEQRLSLSDQTHHKELSDAQNNQARLRDRPVTSDLRLSVFLDAH